MLACSGCNGFRNRFTVQVPGREPGRWTLEEFCGLRDAVFRERKEAVEARRKREYDRYQRWLEGRTPT